MQILTCTIQNTHLLFILTTIFTFIFKNFTFFHTVIPLAEQEEQYIFSHLISLFLTILFLRYKYNNNDEREKLIFWRYSKDLFFTSFATQKTFRSRLIISPPVYRWKTPSLNVAPVFRPFFYSISQALRSKIFFVPFTGGRSIMFVKRETSAFHRGNTANGQIKWTLK